VQILTAWNNEMVKELDFTNEAGNMDYLHSQICKEDKDVIIPTAVLATKRVLLMNWVEGFKITDDDLLRLNNIDRGAILDKIVRVFCRQLFVLGFFNADPHPGNVFVTDDGKLVLLDFGMCVKLDDNVRRGYCKVIEGVSRQDAATVTEGLMMSGYENSQTASHPERDLEFFAFLTRDIGSREEQRKQNKEFDAKRRQQRQESGATPRYFKSVPDSLIFLFRTLGLIRGLATSLDTHTMYLQPMLEYAQRGLQQ
jgi:predicted unusual protein kinase regulating ubiquinone biosynthesis (AarF/ABC1/UbiB family)